MKQVTGTVVDLDTTVLPCTSQATLHAVNLSLKHKRQPTFNSVAEFGQSLVAAEIAKNSALLALSEFAAKLKLNDQQQKARLVHPSQIQSPIPIAQSNSERGHIPLWHYVNAGFHANVPSLDDVVGALHLSPFHCTPLSALAPWRTRIA